MVLSTMFSLGMALVQSTVVVRVEDSWDRAKRETRELIKEIDEANARARSTPTRRQTQIKPVPRKPFIARVPASQSGGWVVSERGAEHTCRMRAVFAGGTSLAFALDPSDGGFFINVGNRNWKSLTQNKKYSIRYEFAETYFEDKDAELSDDDPTVPTLESGFTKDFGSEVVAAPEITIKYGDVVLGVLSLRGSAKAFPEMIQCARRKYDSAAVDPFDESGGKK